MTNDELAARIATQFGTRVSVTSPRPRRMFATCAREELLSLMSWLRDNLGYCHCSTVTGLDSGDKFEALYHLFNGEIELTLRTSAPKTDPHLPTSTGIIPGTTLYERELQDMFGLVIDGHPDPRRYVLPEDWPDGVYPLRKDYKVNAGN
jgi:NADH:ubiquinone oxidoreductase subunit C